uniref:Homeobox domain-containing protein n=1 Tax=Panagrolaimus superbus TaxID=310955 RepID=A0A914Z9U3_9BILA
MANMLQQFSQFLYFKSLFSENAQLDSSNHGTKTLASLFSVTKNFPHTISPPQNLSFPESLTDINNILSSYQKLEADLSNSPSRYHIHSSDNCEKLNKRQYRTHVNYQTAKPLREWWDKNITDPYPTKENIEKLSNATDFTHKQIRDWFTNRRRRFEEKTKGKPLPWNKKSTFISCTSIAKQKTDKA